MFWTKLKQSYIWKRILYERVTEPIHLNLFSILVSLFGSYRAKIGFDLILRQHNAYGILRAADEARKLGLQSVTLIEFGVAAGAGLINMCKIAEKVSSITGIDFNIYGFDTGLGMPPPQDYKDHPELYQQGDFPMNRDQLVKLLPKNAELIIGELSETIPSFIKKLNPESPVGYVVIDVDYYSSAKEALISLSYDSSNYLPITFLYFDDIHEDYHNDWCGELLAIQEFNSENETRKISPYKFLKTKRIFKNVSWLDHIYILHILDHTIRQDVKSSRSNVTLVNPYLSN